MGQKTKQHVDPEKARLIHRIEAASADRAYPGDGHRVANPHHCPECEVADAYFKGRHWHSLVIDGGKLPTSYADLALLTMEAQRFFLPACLIRGLNDTGDWTQWYAVFQVTPPVDPEQRERFDRFAECFTLGECVAVSAFLEDLCNRAPDLEFDPWDYIAAEKRRLPMECRSRRAEEIQNPV